MSNAKGHWYCNECMIPVSNQLVTFAECHESCGYPVEWVENKREESEKQFTRAEVEALLEKQRELSADIAENHSWGWDGSCGVEQAIMDAKLDIEVKNERD